MDERNDGNERLNPEAVNRFRTDSYVVIHDPVFSAADYAVLKQYFESHVRQAPREIRTGNFCDRPEFIPKSADWTGAAPILDLVRPLLGEDLALFSVGVCYKPPVSDYRVGWHSDSHFWLLDRVIEPVDVVTVFIALTDMDRESGCLRLVPRLNEPVRYRHKKVDVERNFFAWEVDDPSVDLTQAIDVPLKENQACLMGPHVLHSSEANRSDRDRIGITVRYVSTRCKFRSDGRKIYLLSGRDQAGNDYGEFGRDAGVGGFSWS